MKKVDRSTFASFCTTYKGGKKDTKVRLNGIFRAIWRVQYARGKVYNHATRWDMRLSENKNQTGLQVGNGFKMRITATRFAFLIGEL